ncbi:oxidoreductase [Dyadobacter aurulentus]|uniref:oxidoreductase n=1 Tax=Dyadobacter sp. UC 10 TaxID=2605428 RepID=UPI0011F147A6|nr:NADH:flavin oxidoreductase [Dyadobacter sp. UC 10]KAA0989120.1 NADH:flavin oxidoreductase [Dyadobacter sp. UC 10]
MNTQQSPLFKAYYIQNKRLSNRFVVAPMTRTSADSTGVPTLQMRDYYASFARGGFGMIVTEGIYTDDLYSQANPNQPGLVTATQLAGWKEIVQEVKRADVLFITQLMHAGALSRSLENTIAPSAILPLDTPEPETNEKPYPLPREMGVNDMEKIKRGFVKAALLAQEAGFDGVELHAANGYLFDQFITPYTNKRTDTYGGSVSNRLRLLAEIFTEIRKIVRPDFIVGIRFSEGKVNDLAYRWEGGAETARAVFSEVAKIHPDYIHIAAEGGKWARECQYPDGSSSNSIARQLTGVPVIANGGMHDQNLSEKLLSTGHADFVSIGRAAIANPDFPDKIRRGAEVFSFAPGMIRPELTLTNTEEYWENAKGNYVAP